MPTPSSVSRRASALALTPVLLLAALLLACAQLAGDSAEEAAPAESPSEHPRALAGIGDHRMQVTANEAAQRWFDQGLALVYGFNHAAAIQAFEQAEKLDPTCAMCVWGQALALGPNINAPMGPDAEMQAHALAEKAAGLASGAAPRDQALIEALRARYAATPDPEMRATRDRDYAEAMRAVRADHSEDVDVAVLFAESLMDLYPWDYWNSEGQPREHTELIVSLLEEVLASTPDHLGANHYYIHATEEFFPEKAEAAADRLGGLAPDAGHLVHMPSHIYWRLGRYQDAVDANRAAAAADEQFFAWCRPGDFYRAAYYPHNVHFLWAAAAAGGQSEASLTAARKLASATSDYLAAFDFMEEFQSIPMLTLVRFGRFDAVLGEPMPSSDHRYLTGIAHYARGLAHVRRGDAAAAEQELAALSGVVDEPAIAELILAGGTSSARQLLQIGEAHLGAEIHAATGNAADAFAQFEMAIALQDGLAYMEPPPWFAPPRQYYGAWLFESGHLDQAEAVYRKDLEKYPKNGWSLFGLAQTLRAQGRDAEASAVEQGFGYAFAEADVTLERSRF